MNGVLLRLAVLWVLLIPCASGWAQPIAQPLNEVDDIVSIMPVFGFGVVELEGFTIGDVGARLYYERLFERHHGFTVEFGVISQRLDFYKVIEDARGLALDGAMGYRWHWKGAQASGFFSLLAGARVAGLDLDAREHPGAPFEAIFMAGNIGYRFVWAESGFTFTVRGGPGIQITFDEGAPIAEGAYLDLEWSLGWRF